MRRRAAELASALLLVAGAAGADPALEAAPRLAPVEPSVRAATTGPGAIAPRAGAASLRALPPPVAGPRTRPGRAWPTPGPIVARFGEPGPGFPWPGLRIAAAPAAAVHAPGRGRVLHADRLGDVGGVLIIAHGDEYVSVLAGLASLDVAVGDRVQVGQAIGRMAEGPAAGLALHLELRRNGRPVDPLPWLGVRVAGDGHS